MGEHNTIVVLLNPTVCLMEVENLGRKMRVLQFRKLQYSKVPSPEALDKQLQDFCKTNNIQTRQLALFTSTSDVKVDLTDIEANQVAALNDGAIRDNMLQSYGAIKSLGNKVFTSTLPLSLIQTWMQLNRLGWSVNYLSDVLPALINAYCGGTAGFLDLQDRPRLIVVANKGVRVFGIEQSVNNVLTEAAKIWGIPFHKMRALFKEVGAVKTPDNIKSLELGQVTAKGYFDIVEDLYNNHLQILQSVISQIREQSPGNTLVSLGENLRVNGLERWVCSGHAMSVHGVLPPQVELSSAVQANGDFMQEDFGCVAVVAAFADNMMNYVSTPIGLENTEVESDEVVVETTNSIPAQKITENLAPAYESVESAPSEKNETLGTTGGLHRPNLRPMPPNTLVGVAPENKPVPKVTPSLDVIDSFSTPQSRIPSMRRNPLAAKAVSVPAPGAGPVPTATPLMSNLRRLSSQQNERIPIPVVAPQLSENDSSAVRSDELGTFTHTTTDARDIADQGLSPELELSADVLGSFGITLEETATEGAPVGSEAVVPELKGLPSLESTPKMVSMTDSEISYGNSFASEYTTSEPKKPEVVEATPTESAPPREMSDVAEFVSSSSAAASSVTNDTVMFRQPTIAATATSTEVVSTDGTPVASPQDVSQLGNITPNTTSTELIERLDVVLAVADRSISRVAANMLAFGVMLLIVGVIAFMGTRGATSGPSRAGLDSLITQEANLQEKIVAQTNYQRMQSRMFENYIPYMEYIGELIGTNISISDFNLIGDASLRINGTCPTAQEFRDLHEKLRSLSTDMEVVLVSNVSNSDGQAFSFDICPKEVS